MLAIRMQRTGRKGHAQYRMLVQDSRQTPSSGRFIAHLGSYNPHSKIAQIDTEKAAFYLTNGAQPSPRVVTILKKEGIKIPEWVKETTEKERKIRNPEKLRKNQPEEEAVAEEKASAEEVEATADTQNDAPEETEN